MRAKFTIHSGGAIDMPTVETTSPFVLVTSCAAPDICCAAKPKAASIGYADRYSATSVSVASLLRSQVSTYPPGAMSVLICRVGADALAGLCSMPSGVT